MTEPLHLFIHTAGRADRQTTLKFLTEIPRNRVHLVVQEHEIRRHEHLVRVGLCGDILTLPSEIKMLSPTRQWIMDYAFDNGLQKIVMMDDDLRMNIRGVPSGEVKATDYTLWVATPAQTVGIFHLLEGWLDEVAHAGISAREGNNREPSEVTEVGRMMRLLAYRTDIFRAKGIRFDRIDSKQDFDVTLQLLRAGYPNRISWKYAHGQASKSGAKGGCSTYRTPEMMSRCAEELAALHPGFVKVVEKETKTSFFGGVRKDVVISWQKAYQSAKVKHVREAAE